MISYLLTSFKESKTIGRAIEAIVHQKNRLGEWELLIASPDEETLHVSQMKQKQYQNYNITVYRDKGKGKPAALNLLFSKARGDIFILTDGDVWIDEYATEKLMQQCSNAAMQQYSLVSGRPISVNDRNTILGFWSHVLTQSADYKRKKLSAKGKYLDASGYLLAVHRNVVASAPDVLGMKQPPYGEWNKIVSALKQSTVQDTALQSLPTTKNDILPHDILADDSYLSHLAWEHSCYLNSIAIAKKLSNHDLTVSASIAYAADALVYVKFPTTFSDWMKQKIRSTGGYLQIQKLFPSHHHMRHFWQEVFEFFIPLKFIRSPKEFFCLLLLYLARLYLWFRIFIFYKVLKRSYSSGWPRIESTK